MATLPGFAADEIRQPDVPRPETEAHDDAAGDSEAAPSGPRPDSFWSKFEVHGFLTQGYAEAEFVSGDFDGPIDETIAMGLPEEGTFDYRNLALQFRYAISPKDTMIVQLSSKAVGTSPFDEFDDEIELDWAFYERRLTDNTSLKIGRVQIPFGIYNEIRDVGTILPFFRPPFAIYREGSFTSETVDGLSLSHVFWPSSTWSLEFDVYGGEWEANEAIQNEQNLGPNDIASVRAEDAIGVQLWLNTPIAGLRFGLAGQTKKLTGGLEGILRKPGERQSLDDILFSLDGSFARWAVRGEIRQFEPTIPGPFGFDIDLELVPWYVQVGFFPTEKLQIWLQNEEQTAEQSSGAFLSTVDLTGRTDLGIALNYLFTPNIVFKAEFHDVEAQRGQPSLVFTPFGPRLDFDVLNADGGNYTILSLSVSF